MLPANRVTFEPIESCLNCDNTLTETDHFCSNCGAKKIEERFTPKRIIKEAGEQVFNVDNTFFRTFIDLFIRPEVVIGGFLSGLRKRYLKAFSYFAISITISGLQILVLKRFFPNVLDGFFDQNTNKVGHVFQDILYEYQPILMFSTIPFLAFLGWLTFFTLRKHNYTEHLIIQLYTYSHLSILATLVGITILVSGLDYSSFLTFGTPLYIFYYAYVFKRLYRLSASGIVLRSLFFIAMFILLYIVIIMIVVITILIINPELLKEIAQVNG